MDGNPNLRFHLTYLSFGTICDILRYHKFSGVSFSAGYLNLPQVGNDDRGGKDVKSPADDL